MVDEPQVIQGPGFLCRVEGPFFRAVDPKYAGAALQGSSKPARYSGPEQPTLYLSASLAGVAAAMVAHQREGDADRDVLRFQVEADDIFDLRNPKAIERAREMAGEPFADWQKDLECGRKPSSWHVRNWIEEQGAKGLIDPSRRGPGLWHLVLFRWNTLGTPSVKS